MKITIGETIRRLRREQNITQEQLAEQMNVSIAAVSKWERCETYPDITMLFPLAHYFGVTLDVLMGYDAVKVEDEITSLLKRANELHREGRYTERTELLKQAKQDFPSDYRILNLYMWQVGGDYADNDPAVLLAHKEEFLQICDKILDGCRDNRIRLDALNMQAKLLYADGKTEEALAVYRENFSDWYQTVGQKSEQLFAKDTPEFCRQLRLNLYELSDLAANKKLKEIWYCIDGTLADKAAQGIALGEALISFCETSGYSELWLAVYHVFSDHSVKLRCYGGSEADSSICQARLIEAARRCDELAQTCETVQEYIKRRYLRDHLSAE